MVAISRQSNRDQEDGGCYNDNLRFKNPWAGRIHVSAQTITPQLKTRILLSRVGLVGAMLGLVPVHRLDLNILELNG
jgi:hypothetical protein